MSFSLISAPSFKAAPQSTVSTFVDFYARGQKVMPKVAVAVALSYAYAAYVVSVRGGRWTGFAAAGACVVAIVPFTLTVMKRTITDLHQAARNKTGDSAAAARVSGLLDTWITMNFSRGVMVLAGTLLGTRALLQEVL
ncbi:hypothetical protein HIM_03264 [Hirsutella minnesotensis 3608]|nr:hypothetical protein HIM_03264 [Hirsutella minnesotensis 3608]